MKKQVWYDTDLGYAATRTRIERSPIVGTYYEDKGRFTFLLKDFKDVTFQITSKQQKLSITYPEGVDHQFCLEKVRPLLVKADSNSVEKIDLVIHRSKLDSSLLGYTPHIKCEITQTILGQASPRQLPKVGFNMLNQNDYPIKAKIEARVILGNRFLGIIQEQKGYYSGKRIIGLNADKGFTNGSFSVPEECVCSTEELTIELRIIVIDPDNKEHEILPESWTYNREVNGWFYEPTSFTD